MRYSDNLDYLVAAITYLGTHTYFWARTPEHMSRELGLNEEKLLAVFDGFPGIFRKSRNPAPESTKKQHFYSLQARYALREGRGTAEPEQVSNIEALQPRQVEMNLDFVLKASQMELDSRRAVWTNWISSGAAVVAAIAAIIVASIKL